MDPVNVIQLVFAGTTALVLGRMGLALARYFERRLAGAEGANQAESRLRAVEDECTMLRQELSELQERQDFTERVLHQGPVRERLPHLETPEKRAVTPR